MSKSPKKATTSDDKVRLPLTDMAKLVLVTPRRLQQYARLGVIPSPVKGKYELFGTVHGVLKYKDQQLGGVDGGSEAFTKERARKTSASADIAEMERDKMRGIYLHIEEVSMAWLAIVQTVKTRLLLLPNKIGARILAERTPLAAQKLLRDEITEALKDLGKYTAASVPPGGGRASKPHNVGTHAATAADNI